MLCLTRLMQGSARTGYEASGEQGYPPVVLFLLEYFNALISQNKYEVSPAQTHYLESWFSPNSRSSWQPFLSPHREPNPSRNRSNRTSPQPRSPPPPPSPRCKKCASQESSSKGANQCENLCIPSRPVKGQIQLSSSPRHPSLLLKWACT